MRSLLPALVDRAAPRPERLVDFWFDGLFDDSFFAPAGVARTFAPPVDVTENDNEYLVRCEVPGLEPKDLEIEHTGDMLTIRGEKKNQLEGSKDGYQWTESSYGSFTRAFRLAKTVDATKIAAELKNGVLTIHVPKAEEAKPRRIEVKAASGSDPIPASGATEASSSA